MHSQGTGAPIHVHPYDARRKDSAQVNLTQRSPYIHKEHHKYQKEYLAFCEAMEQVFIWIVDKVSLVVVA